MFRFCVSVALIVSCTSQEPVALSAAVASVSAACAAEVTTGAEAGIAVGPAGVAAGAEAGASACACQVAVTSCKLLVEWMVASIFASGTVVVVVHNADLTTTVAPLGSNAKMQMLHNDMDSLNTIYSNILRKVTQFQAKIDGHHWVELMVLTAEVLRSGQTFLDTVKATSNNADCNSAVALVAPIEQLDLPMPEAFMCIWPFCSPPPVTTTMSPTVQTCGYLQILNIDATTAIGDLHDLQNCAVARADATPRSGCSEVFMTSQKEEISVSLDKVGQDLQTLEDFPPLQFHTGTPSHGTAIVLPSFALRTPLSGEQRLESYERIAAQRAQHETATNITDERSMAGAWMQFVVGITFLMGIYVVATLGRVWNQHRKPWFKQNRQPATQQLLTPTGPAVALPAVALWGRLFIIGLICLGVATAYVSLVYSAQTAVSAHDDHMFFMAQQLDVIIGNFNTTALFCHASPANMSHLACFDSISDLSASVADMFQTLAANEHPGIYPQH